MTYQELVDKKFKMVAFSYKDRVLIIRVASVKETDFENTEYSHMLSDNIPAYKASRTPPCP